MNTINRTNQYLVLVLVLQFVLIGAMFWPRSTVAVGSGKSLLENFKADQVVKVNVRDGAGTELKLEKKAGNWVVPAADDYPVRAGAVDKFLELAAGMKADRVITKTASSQKQLKVTSDQYERRVELEAADGTKQVFFLGTAASATTAHVRVDGQDTVYLVSGMTSNDAGVSVTTWIDTNYLTLAQADVTTLKVQNKNGTFEFVKDGTGAWGIQGLAAGETLDTTIITGLVTSLSELRMNYPLGKQEKPEYGLNQASALVTVTIKPKDGAEKSITLKVGAKLADGAYVAISSESPYYVALSEYAVKEFVENGHQNWLVQPTPTPAPQPTAAQ